MKYFKIGKDAHVFYDPKTQLKVSSVPGETDKPITTKITNAVGNGHIIEITKEEYSDLIKKIPVTPPFTSEYEEEDPADNTVKDVDFSRMSQKDVLDYIAKTYEPTPEEMTTYEVLKKKELISKIKEWEAA